MMSVPTFKQHVVNSESQETTAYYCIIFNIMARAHNSKPRLVSPLTAEEVVGEKRDGMVIVGWAVVGLNDGTPLGTALGGVVGTLEGVKLGMLLEGMLEGVRLGWLVEGVPDGMTLGTLLEGWIVGVVLGALEANDGVNEGVMDGESVVGLTTDGVTDGAIVPLVGLKKTQLVSVKVKQMLNMLISVTSAPLQTAPLSRDA
jgi:hypothetical protein